MSPHITSPALLDQHRVMGASCIRESTNVMIWVCRSGKSPPAMSSAVMAARPFA